MLGDSGVGMLQQIEPSERPHEISLLEIADPEHLKTVLLKPFAGLLGRAAVSVQFIHFIVTAIYNSSLQRRHFMIYLFVGNIFF